MLITTQGKKETIQLKPVRLDGVRQSNTAASCEILPGSPPGGLSLEQPGVVKVPSKYHLNVTIISNKYKN